MTVTASDCKCCKQIHAGSFKGGSIWHSNDGGKTWWSGLLISNSSAITTEQLKAMCKSILKDLGE